MAQVEVWNDNRFAHKEEFKGQKIEIPAGKCIPMDANEAVEFRGQYCTIKLDGNGQQLAESYKMIRIGKTISDDKTRPTATFKCQADGKEFFSKEDLDAHIRAQHLAAIEDPEVAKKFENAEPKKRGRPRKDQSELQGNSAD